MPGEILNVYHDTSGRVTVAVFRQKSANAQQHFVDSRCEIAQDMVLVGGGAVAGNEQGEGIEPGALLTASYPNDQLSAWVASSKDHMHACPHWLTVYAIGLSIAGMTPDALRASILVESADSGEGSHPEATAHVPGGFLLISGGFKVDTREPGNLGTASFPSNSFSWTARSKDHELPCSANIRSFAICLRERLPVGTIAVSIASTNSGVAPHPAASANVEDGVAITGGGAEVHWRGAGNLLWKLECAAFTGSQQYFAAASKDHDIPDPSAVTAYVLGIALR